MSEIRFIAVEGVVKRTNTSVAQALAKLAPARTILDEDSASPVIDVASSDPGDLLLKKHLLRLVDRYKMQKQLWQTEIFYDYIISDYLFYADRVYANLKLTPDDLMIYDTLMDTMEKDVVVPDLILYLQTNPETIIERLHAQYGIRRNARASEAIDEDYIRDLNNEFNQFFMHFRWCPVLIVNANQLDPDDMDHVRDLFHRIQRPTAGISFYNPTVSPSRPHPPR